MPSSISIGSKYEKEVEKDFQEKGYKTHRNIKSRFGTQDIFGIADVVATNSSSFLLVACAVGRAQTATVAKIKAIRPFIPDTIGVKYYIKKKNGETEIRSYD